MKPIHKLLLAAILLPMAAHAALPTWGTWTAVTNNEAIQTLGGYTTIEGVNFNGSTTTINNGPGGSGGTNVTFTAATVTSDLPGNDNAIVDSVTLTAATVSVSNMDFASTSGGNSNVSSAIGSPQNWGTVLDRVIGDFGTGCEITLSGLTNGSQYYVQFFSANPDGNGQNTMKISSGGADSPLFGTHTAGQTRYIIATFTADGSSQVFTPSGGEPHFSALVIGVQAAGDTTPPVWTATWPQVDPLSSTSLTVRAKTNESGTAHYVVLPDGAAAPTSAQVKAGTDSTNTPVSASGSLALTANTEATAPVGSLSPSTAYDVYFVAEDAVPNVQVSPVKVDASTLAPDITAPDWIATWPKAEQLSATSITVRAQTNENGTAYYVVLADGATAPSAAQVKAGQDNTNTPATASGSLALTANVEATGPVTGLTADTSYDVYFIAEDAVPNLQATPVLVDVSLVTPAAVTWGSVTTIVDDSSIVTTGVTGLVGANFANSAVSPLTANGVTFTAVTLNSSANIGGGITVATSGMDYTNLNSGISDVPASDFGTIMDSHTGTFGGTGTITLSGLVGGTQYQIQFFASTNDTNALQNQTITGGANTSAAFGPHAAGSGKTLLGTFTAIGTTQVLTIQNGEVAANALTIGVVSAGNTFADWINSFSGLNGLTAFGDDADFDGLDNGLENFLGTAPNVGNAGLTAGTLSGNVFTFTHPQNATPASDVSAPVYTWSTDLVNWNASNASSGGITVVLAPDTDNPVAGTTTVTATVTVGTVPAKLFVRLGVSQE
jgi:hypothetical protein